MAMNFNVFDFKGKQKHKKSVEIDGKIFESLTSAARHYQCYTSTISYAAKMGTFRGLPIKYIKTQKNPTCTQV